MIMKYKNYLGQIEYDDEAKIFHGNVLGINDVITFQGTSIKELEKALKDSVETYLEWCEKRGREPEKPYSGKIRVRIEPDLHAKLVRDASLHGVSLNSLITEKLKK